MSRRADGKPGWTLDLAGPGGTTKEDFDFVAICTGQFNEPRALPLPGEDVFKARGGQILHSSQYSDAALAKGRKVVVLGGSKSATDIAVNAVNSGASEVTIVYREPVWRMPYFVGGLVNFKRIIYIRAQEQMFASWGIGPHGAGWRMRSPNRSCGQTGAGWRACSRRSSSCPNATWYRRHGSRTTSTARCRSQRPISTRWWRTAASRRSAAPSTITTASSIVMSTGERVAADIAVLAIGYKLGVPFLPEAYRKKLVEADGQYRLYRLIANPDLPDLGFVGFNSSFCTVLCADMAAQWLVRYADGQLAQSAERARDARQHRDDAALQARRTAGGGRLWRACASHPITTSISTNCSPTSAPPSAAATAGGDVHAARRGCLCASSWPRRRPIKPWPDPSATLPASCSRQPFALYDRTS